MLSLSDATLQAFKAALQGVVTAGVASTLYSTYSAAPGGKVACLSLPHIRFAFGVAGDSDLPPIWKAVAQVQGKMEGMVTLNQALIRGLPSCRRIFGERAHFRASVPLLALVKNFLLVNPSLYPAYAGGGGGYAGVCCV